MPTQPHGESEAEPRILGRLRLAVELSIGVLLIEAAGAFASRSLALTVDAVHNVPDIVAFTVSWAALRGTRAGTSSAFTFGTHRLEVVAAILNGLLVLGTGVAFGYVALDSLLRSSAFAGGVQPVWLLTAAFPTLTFRLANLLALGRLPGRVRDLNLRGVMLHLAGDLAITAALLGAGISLLLRPSFASADAVAALAIAAILAYESFPLLRDGWEVLTEQTPRGLSVEKIVETARSVPGVAQLHDVHVWAVCSSLVCLTAHVEVGAISMQEGMTVVERLRQRMEQEFGIVHATFEIESH
jgi:cobalt-zinc-cadmium efflux system protein